MSATTIPPSLEAFLEDRGARFDDEAGSMPVPAHYGDPEEEVRRLRRGAAVAVRPEWGGLELRGEDRVRFLNGQVTNDVASLGTGQVRRSFATDVKGRVRADLWIAMLDERIWVEVSAGRAEDLAAHLERYRIADRVEIVRSGSVALTVFGPVSSARTRAEPSGGHGVTEDDSGGPIVRHPVAGLEAVTFWATPERAADRLTELVDSVTAEGGALVGRRALDTLRVEAGMPAVGREIGDDSFPQETGLEEETVSYDKGCYLGQEVVARIHYRGAVKRSLRGLRFPGGSLPAPGADLSLGGRTVGSVGTAVQSPRFGPIGLAIVHHRAEPGATVEVDGLDEEAEVVALPFDGDRDLSAPVPG